jgi:hypothetical protein
MRLTNDGFACPEPVSFWGTNAPVTSGLWLPYGTHILQENAQFAYAQVTLWMVHSGTMCGGSFIKALSGKSYAKEIIAGATEFKEYLFHDKEMEKK